MTDTITPSVASAASMAGITPGRRTISRSGAAATGAWSATWPISSAIRFGSGRTSCTRTSATSAMPPAASHGTVSERTPTSLPANMGLKTVGPRIAPKTEPKRTYEIPRARRAAGYMSPAAVRISSDVALTTPIRTNPAITRRVESVRVASAVNPQPIAPSAKPALITGVRPTRSISRPAGTAVRAEALRKIAGPSPRRPLTPVTRTNVSDDTAATSWSTAELTAIVAARRSVLRRTGSAAGCWPATPQFNQAAEAASLLQWLHEACGDCRAGRRRDRRLQFVVFPAADHNRRSPDVPAGRLRSRTPPCPQARADPVLDRPAVGRSADEVPNRARSAHGDPPDHRAER